MPPAARIPVLLTWEDIATQAEHLPQDEQALLRDIVAARRPAVSDATITGESWYLSEVSVQGHIGIGESPLSVPLRPANGVTVISARNGVGKTSVADALRHLLSGGMKRGYELAEDNIHCTDRLLSAAVVSGSRVARISCGGDRVVRWREPGRAEGDVPAQWVAAFERYRPVLLHPEISPVIDKPNELHKFLKGALELTALEQLQTDIDDIRKQGSGASRTVTDAHQQATAATQGLPDASFHARLSDLGQEPSPQEVAELRRLIADLPASSPEHVELAETWQVDDTVVQVVIGAIQRAQAARQSIIGGAKTVQAALDGLLGDDGAYISDLRDRDVCPTCQTAGAGWVATATALAQQLRDLLADQSAAEHDLEQQLSRLREDLPPPLPARTRQALQTLDDAQVADRIAQWERLAADSANLTGDTAGVDDVAALAAGARDLAIWFDQAKRAIVASRSESTADLAIARKHVEDWLDTWDDTRATLARASTAEKLVNKVTIWIKRTRSEIFEPIGKQITQTWAALNRDADLEMSGIALGGGTRQAQKVSIELAAAGTPLPAQLTKPAAVLSTGQRNALSLATYLPRATQPGSPFRFLVLDDPVHAFDHGRVRYLAEQLAALGDRYQIIVFTHDDRLWRELRALGIHPTHIRLQRPPGGNSQVRIKDITRPSRGMLDEAGRALNQEQKTPLGTAGARATMVLALCRQAIDTEVATQLEIVGRRLGLDDDPISKDLGGARKTRDQLDLLNTYAKRAKLPPVDYQPHERLITNLNAATHGRAITSASIAVCRAWIKQARQLADKVHAVTG